MVTNGEFNTGRHYAADGQRIKYTLGWSEKLCTHVVAFVDVSRGLWGWFVYCGITGDVRQLERNILAAYDCHAYCSDSPENFARRHGDLT